MADKVNLAEKLSQFHELWSPRIVGDLNGQQVKLAKLKGEFVWHQHDDEDELFLVLQGSFDLHLRDRVVTLAEGEFFIVPRGTEHKPVAQDEVHVLLLEPATTLNTGNVRNERTVAHPERLTRSSDEVDRASILTLWDGVRAGLLETVDRFQDEELDYVPYPLGRSVREQILHIAHEEHGEYGLGIAQTLDAFPPPFDAADYPTLDAVKALLARIHDPIRAEVARFRDEELAAEIVTPWGTTHRRIEMIGHLVEHEIHHRGELSLVLGLLGREGLDA
jgi:mannose-6-phosphate isomerase-like protein (cupin superfamily)/uncharacterized damage-inducible protein DinB